MNIRIAARSAQQGSIILISLFVAAIAGVALASYLILTETQNVSIYRSQAWNTALTVTEAGIEDALQLVNRYAGSFEPDDLPKWTNHTAESNWQSLGGGLYYVKRYIPVPTSGGAWQTNSYEVWVTNIANEPKIYATATVPWTFQYASAPQAMFAMIGGNATVISTEGSTASSLPPVRRDVYVKTKLDPLFAVAMAAVDVIDLMGNNIQTDSFDSADPNFSNGGFYPYGQIWKTKANGDVCTDRALINSLNVGNANIKGHVRTGPGVNTITIGPNGSVGDRAWVEGGRKGIQPGRSGTDFNVVFPDVVLPAKPWLPVVKDTKTIDGVSYDYVFADSGTRYYRIDSTIKGNVLVNAPADAIVNILITTSVKLTSQVIRIANTGAKVRVYMAGSQFSLSGNGWIDNQSGIERFYLFGLPTCTSITLGGNSQFYGGVYAPNADYTLGGGGNDTWDFVGASVTRTVKMNGHFNFHFDENLARIGPGRGYIPVSWNER